MLILNRSQVRSVASMSDAIALMKTAFRELTEGRAISPLRIPIEVDSASRTLFMPATVPGADALGLKVVSVFGRNPDRGLPTINAVVTLIDRETGVPLAALDGGYITSLRTGAVSGAATDLMARADAKTLVVIGPGVQGVTQAAAVAAVRNIERIIVVGRRQEGLDWFKATVARDWPYLLDRIELTSEVAASVRQADVICTATSSSTPVFDDADVRDGTHINAVGAFTHEMQEVPSATVARAYVVVDNFEAAYAEAGDLVNPVSEGLVTASHFRRELGHVVAGTERGRENDSQVTFFKSVGNAVQDLVVARMAVDRARERGLGVEIDLTA
ncbi:ornithine cyclodeaminase [soil metagenome]